LPAACIDIERAPRACASLPRMLQVFLPQSELIGIVECGVVVERAAGSLSRFPAMPRAMLTWGPSHGRGAEVAFHAMSTRALTHTHLQSTRALGLVLPPVTAARLMGLSTGALVDTTLPWADLAGPAEARRLEEGLHQARTDPARLALLQTSLQRVLSHGPERVRQARAESLHRLCAAVGAQGARAATPLGLGERQLERRCRSLLGLTPKQLQRMARMHALLSGILRQQRLPDAGVALSAGFYDQSHLAREVRLLTGTTLRDLLEDAHADGAWWPLGTQQHMARRPG
jgi:AraC-like DNA-binding protein